MSRRSGREPKLEELRGRISQWRANRQGREMPEELWVAAAGLAQRLGVSQVASALGLGYRGLKARVGAAPLVEAERPAFVELRGAQLLGAPPGTVRIELSRGETQMSITLPGAYAPDVVAAVTAFARA